MSPDISLPTNSSEVFHESEERFRTLFESSPIPISLHSPDGKYLQTNKAYQDMLGYTDEELRHMGVKNVTHPHDVPEGRRLFEDLRLGKRDFYQRDKRFLRKDGCVIWAHSTVSAVRNSNKNLRYLISVVEDVTRRKELAEEILAVSEREKQRFGQDLHDGLCQNLIALKFRCALLEKKLSQQSLSEAGDARQVGELLRQGIQEAYNLAQGLQPARLMADGLKGALEELAASTASAFDVECVFWSRNPIHVNDNNVAIHLYRIAQEAVSNAIKHGKADRLRIGLATWKGQLILSIQDDGVGFSEPLPDRRGLGLRIMNHRALMIGAQMTIRRRQDGGMRVVCTYPALGRLDLNGGACED